MDAERNDAPICRFPSWKSNFSLELLTANLADVEAGKKEGKGIQGYGPVPVSMFIKG